MKGRVVSDRPILVRGISSQGLRYSWNLYHSWRPAAHKRTQNPGEISDPR